MRNAYRRFMTETEDNRGKKHSNTDAGDGCSPTCQIEAGFICSGGSINTLDACTAVCGDGRRVGSEICDDGSTVSLDGCRGDCGAIEDGFTCAGGSSTSADTCVSCDTTCAVCSGPSATDCTAVSSVDSSCFDRSSIACSSNESSRRRNPWAGCCSRSPRRAPRYDE